jgi:hypothetical protein
MQFQEEDEAKKNLSTERHIEQQPELSDPWLELLGGKNLDLQDSPPVQANDPWNDLLQAQGIEVVDLQQVRLHTIQVSMDNLEVEQALDMMQEKPVNRTSEP